MRNKLNLYKFCFVYIVRVWIKTRPAQKLLARVKFTGNLYSYRTCVNVNGHHWNVCYLVFTGTRIQVPVRVNVNAPLLHFELGEV